MTISFQQLRDANAERQVEWEDADRLPLEYWGNALAGEVGEACNVVKKLAREKHGLRGSRATLEELGEELADVIIYADLLAKHFGLDLGEAVRLKFNKTSDKYGLNVTIP